MSQERSTNLTTSQIVRLVAAACAILLLVIFVALNFEDVTVDLLIVEADMKLAFALILSALLGLVAGLLAPHRR
jgi:uncharacterized integral membrane protein